MTAARAAPGPTRRALGASLRGRLVAAPAKGAGAVAVIALASVAFALVAARLPAPDGLRLWNLDLPKIDAPLAVFFHEALARGGLPLWSDRLGLGFPLYAEGQIGAFYPPNWLLGQLPPLDALDAGRLVHLALAGCGAGLLALRAIGSSTRGALAASVLAAGAAVLAGGVTAKLEWTNFVAADAWLPWVLLPLVRRPAPTPRGLVGAGAAFGLQALAGHPTTWLLTGLAAVVVLLARRPGRAALGQAALVGAIGAAIGAVQLVPTAALTLASVRAGGLPPDDVFASAASPFDPLLFGFANAFLRGDANGWLIHAVWYPDGIFALYEASAYVGLGVLALAALGALRREGRPFAALALVMLAVPAIAAFRPAAWLAIPVLDGLRSPTRAYVVVDVCLAILAAIGLARAVAPAQARRGGPRTAALRARLGTIAGAVVGLELGAYGLVLALAAVAPAAFDALRDAASVRPDAAAAGATRTAALDALSTPLPVLAEAVLGLAVAALAGGLALTPVRAVARAVLGPSGRAGAPVPVGRAVSAVAALVAALALAPLVLFSPAANTLGPAADLVLTDAPLAVALRAVAPHRVLTLGAPGYYDGAPDRLAAAGVPDIEMFSSLDLAAGDALVARLRAGGAGGAGVPGPGDPAVRDAAALRAAVGIDTIVTFEGEPCPGDVLTTVPEDAAVICRPAIVLRPPYWIPAAAARLVPGATDPLGAPVAEVDLAQALAGAIPQPEAASRDPGRRTVALDAPGDGWLYLDSSAWPGWQVSVDGAAVRPAAALGGLLVPVAAGEHGLELRLVPLDALAGLAAGVTLLAVLALGGVVARRRGGERASRRAGERAAGERAARRRAAGGPALD